MLANSAVANLSGTNTGDNAVNSLYSGLISNATHTGEVTGATVLTIANNAVTTSKVLDANITTSKILDANVTDAKIATVSATKITGILPIANGGTGSSAQNFVDLTTAQTIAGAKTFTTDLQVNGITVGKGKGNMDNTAMGLDALNASTGAGNTAIGKVALTKNTIGAANVAVGQGSLFTNLEGGSNTAIGYDALRLNVGSQNTGVGRDALKGSVSGSSNNTAIGYQALKSTPTSSTGSLIGTYNTAVGSGAGSSITSGSYNIAVGGGSGANLSTGSYNIAVGGGDGIYTGSRNTLIGYQAKVPNGSYSYATAIGNEANAGTNATAVGNKASSGLYATAIGNEANAADNATAVGYQAKASAGNSTAIGNGAVASDDNTIQLGNTDVTNVNTSGTITAGTVNYPNTHNNQNGQILTVNSAGLATWAAAGVPYIGATQAVDLGAFDLKVNGITVGRGDGNQSNTAIGFDALKQNVSGNENTASGQYSLFNNSEGNFNTASGVKSLFSNTKGEGNTAIGNKALQYYTEGNYNTAIGHEALSSDTYSNNGSYNTAIGYGAGVGYDPNNPNNKYVDRYYATAIGFAAIAEADNATAIGNGAKASAGNSTAIGNEAVVALDNTIQLGNLAITNVKTYGTLTAGNVTYPKTDGSVGQILATNGNGIVSFISIPTLNQNTTGSAATLTTARNINGVPFNGSADITVTAGANTLTGTTLASNVINSSLTSVGTLTNLTVTNSIVGSITGNAATVTTNANLTGDVTSLGNATTIGAGKVTNNMLAGLIDLTSKVTGILPIANGGTGSSTQNFVDLTTAQSIAGEKTFTTAPVLSTATASQALFTDANRNIVSKAITGTGSVVMSESPTLTGTIVAANQTLSGTLFVGTTSPNSSAVLEASSTTKGFLPPRLNTSQRDLIGSPVAGLTIWNTDNKQLEVYDGSYWVNMNGKLVSTLTVGQSYGGGKVAYIFTSSDPGYVAGQTHGLIAAESDQTTDAVNVKWFPSSSFYGATAISLGQGALNTITIIAAASGAGTTDLSSYAAGLASNYRGGGYSDWYLPSKEELNKLYINRASIGGFANTGNLTYWSSSQKGSIDFTNFTSFAKGISSAWLQFFFTGSSSEGTQSDLGITNTRRVRAIRSF